MPDIKGRRILMALTRFDIGGAETHVLELSLELQRMGYGVVVVSNGGVYEQNLKEAGIPHYKIPMHSKTPKNIAKSLKELRRVIKEEKIDIVHAHGRIPAFLCGILHKVMKFTFVTTAHWVFDTSHGLKYVSNWGEKVMAVSVDIKQYLMENYRTNPADIYITINGIDTDKFCKDADASSVIEEFALNPDARKIVYISRMDADRALVAFQLVEIAPELLKVNPELEIVIVGGGNVFDELKIKADAMNEKLGRRAIVLTGGRTDIYKFAALGDWFVGVSRSALEAMACEKPAIIAGNEGYIGIFDEDKLDVSIDTNFCCRGLEESTTGLLLRDLKILMTNPEEENVRLGTYGRNLILSHYSLSKMAKDCEKMYIAANDSKKWDAVISGYYGYKNSGDESLLYAMLENLRAKKDDIRLLVLSKAPEQTEKTYGVHAINRYDILKIRRALKTSKLLIFGGGSLIQDVTSDKSLWYYLHVIKQAMHAKTPVMFYANGIGPVKKEVNRKKVRAVMNKVDMISLRDANSYEEMKRMGVNLSRTVVTADPALTIEGCDTETAKKLLKEEWVPTDKKLLGISVRSWKSCSSAYWDKLARCVEDICLKYDYVAVWIPLKHRDDIVISKEVASKMKIRSYVLRKAYTAPEIVGIVGCCDLMIAMRLHAMIYATESGVPAVGLSYDPKVSGFVKYIGVNKTVNVEDFTEDKLMAVTEEIILNRDSVQETLNQKLEELKEKALENADMAMELIQKSEKR